MTTRAPGLTEAMRRALSNLDGNRAVMERLCELGLIREVFPGDYRITPRGQAALAAPRVTVAELAMLERLESWSGIVHGRDITTAANLHMRGLACAFKSGGFIKVRKTDAGTTALNNIRAASGPPEWKEAK